MLQRPDLDRAERAKAAAHFEDVAIVAQHLGTLGAKQQPLRRRRPAGTGPRLPVVRILAIDLDDGLAPETRPRLIDELDVLDATFTLHRDRRRHAVGRDLHVEVDPLAVAAHVVDDDFTQQDVVAQRAQCDLAETAAFATDAHRVALHLEADVLRAKQHPATRDVATIDALRWRAAITTVAVASAIAAAISRAALARLDAPDLDDRGAAKARAALVDHVEPLDDAAIVAARARRQLQQACFAACR